MQRVEINFEVFIDVRHFRDILSYPRISCNILGLFSSLAQGLLTWLDSFRRYTLIRVWLLFHLLFSISRCFVGNELKDKGKCHFHFPHLLEHALNKHNLSFYKRVISLQIAEARKSFHRRESHETSWRRTQTLIRTTWAQSLKSNDTMLFDSFHLSASWISSILHSWELFSITFQTFTYSYLLDVFSLKSNKRGEVHHWACWFQDWIDGAKFANYKTFKSVFFPWLIYFIAQHKEARNLRVKSGSTEVIELRIISFQHLYCRL